MSQMKTNIKVTWKDSDGTYREENGRIAITQQWLTPGLCCTNCSGSSNLVLNFIFEHVSIVSCYVSTIQSRCHQRHGIQCYIVYIYFNTNLVSFIMLVMPTLITTQRISYALNCKVLYCFSDVLKEGPLEDKFLNNLQGMSSWADVVNPR